MNSLFPVITEFRLMPGSVLYSTALGGILIGCPPEVLKALLAQHYPMPNTVVIPGTLRRGSSSQACLEFPFYHFLFIQQGLAQGKKFKVLAESSLLPKLEQMLRVTLTGPTQEEALGSEKRLGLPAFLDQTKVSAWARETNQLALKGKDGHTLQVKELVEFIPFNVGDDLEVFPAVEDQPAVWVKRLGADSFSCRSNGNEHQCDLVSEDPQIPVYELTPVPVTAKEKKSHTAFNLRLLGTSEGFDPLRPANGLLLRLQGKWFLWDCPSYLRLHLQAIGLTLDDVEGIFVSHVHEDHLEVAETLSSGRRLKIYSSPEIFECMLVKVMALLNCDYQEALSHYEFVPLYADQPFDLFGANLEVFYSVHSIPALGLRLEVPQKKGQPKRLFVSGDQLSNAGVEKLAEAGVMDKVRKAQVDGRFMDHTYDAVFVDVGGGMIHGDPKDFFHRQDPVYYMHTGKALNDLPKGHQSVHPGQRVVIVPE